MQVNLCVSALLLLLTLHQSACVLWGTFNQQRPEHDVSGRVRLLNHKTIQIEDFTFDGNAITVYVYFYRPGDVVDRRGGGTVIPVPSDQGGGPGGVIPNRRFNGETMRLPLPDDVDACDISTLTIWCEPFISIFNRVTLTREFFENDGADPCAVQPQYIEEPISTPAPPEFNNCLFLNPALKLSWRVNDNEANVRFQLCGCLPTTPGVNQYMGFGVSGSDSGTLMFGADPTITWVDSDSQAYAEDYHLSDYTQCVTDQGACPDTVRGCTNDAQVVGGFRDSSQQCVTFIRPFTPSDEGTCDRPLDPNGQHIVWAVGSLGNTAFRHFLNADFGTSPLNMSRTPADECGETLPTCAVCLGFPAQRIIAREDTTFRAYIGPSGNERGYTSITGLPSWGISWYINGMMIPELVVERGSTYTFTVEGGNEPTFQSSFHPFYITDSIVGNRLSDETVKNSETVYAGFNELDQPTGVGRLCQFSETPESADIRTTCGGLQGYIDSLSEPSECSQGTPGTVTWTPDDDTPNTVYYQCATHRNLGWRILVVDKGDPTPPLGGGASSTHTVTVLSVLVCLLLALYALQ